MAERHLFIFGLGYVGVHLATELSKKGWKITGTTRKPAKFIDPLSGQQTIPDDWTILPFEDGTAIPELAQHLDSASHVITTISALAGHDPVMATHKKDMRGFSGWAGYVSATSVYPDQEEGFIDEDVPADPATKRGRHRVEAENQWRDICQAEILRVAGIYGPGRNAIEALQQGRARIIEKQGQLSNRIHQSDITKIICAAMDRPRPERIVNLCDEEPAPQGEVVRYAAQLLGVEPPEPIPFEQAELTPMARSFYVSRRRLRSKIIGPELGIELDYPTYREGLRALLEGQEKA